MKSSYSYEVLRSVFMDGKKNKKTRGPQNGCASKILFLDMLLLPTMTCTISSQCWRVLPVGSIFVHISSLEKSKEDFKCVKKKKTWLLLTVTLLLNTSNVSAAHACLCTCCYGGCKTEHHVHLGWCVPVYPVLLHVNGNHHRFYTYTYTPTCLCLFYLLFFLLLTFFVFWWLLQMTLVITSWISWTARVASWLKTSTSWQMPVSSSRTITCNQSAPRRGKRERRASVRVCVCVRVRVMWNMCDFFLCACVSARVWLQRHIL